MAEKSVLDPSSILHSIVRVAPGPFKTPFDALAAASHAIMLSVGFRFAGLGEDARQEGDGTVTRLPEAWNALGPQSYAFRYSHPQSSLTFVIKSLKLGDRWIVHGLAFGDDKTATLDIVSQDYTSASFFPYDPQTSEEPLVHGFISTSRFNDFIILFKINVLQKLIPGLSKPGYEDTSTTSTSSAATSSTPSAGIPDPRFRPRPERYVEDDHRGIMDPFSVGRSDLDPLGGGLRMPGQGDGMFVGPGHPIFGPRGDFNDPSSYGGPYSPQRGSVPPGARFDPIAPFGPLGPSAGRPRGNPRDMFRGRPPAGQYRGEPDNDELPPPGGDYMFM